MTKQSPLHPSMKILLRLLLAACCLTSFNMRAQTTYTWNGTTGNWIDSTRWTPNGVPGAADTAIINSGSVTVSADTSVNTLNLTNGTLTGTATLTVTNTFNWAGGTITGTGTLTLPVGSTGTLSSSGAKTLDGGRVLNNAGTLVWTGTGGISFYLGTWNNSGLLDCQSDATMHDGSTSGVGSFFNNSGTVRKSVGTGTTTFSNLESFANSGTVDVQSGSVTMSATPFHNNGTARSQAGTLTVAAGGTGGGTFEAVSPGLVSFTGGTSTLTNGARLTGTGTNRVAGATVTMQDSVGAERLEVTSGTLNGTGTVTVTNEFHWSGGTLGGTGALTTLAGSVGTISGTAAKTLDGGRVLNNAGTLVWTGTGGISFYLGTWNNSGLLDCQSDATMHDGSSSGVGSFFNNSGTVRKSAGTGTTTFSSLEIFANSGTVDIRAGILSLSGNYSPTSASTHRFAVGGYEAGTGFGRLSVSGTLTLAGQLDLMLTNSFIPTNTAIFAIITASSRSGTFASVTGRGVGNGLYFSPTYPANGVTLTVADGTPSFSSTNFALVNGQFQMRLNGVASETYRIDASTNMASPTNWVSISTNIIPGSGFLDYLDTDATNYAYRFYRAVFLP
jgi:hypothetical protein